jgi:hypothetical protein
VLGSNKNGVSGEMDREFHYYMTHLIALSAGFSPGDAFKEHQTVALSVLSKTFQEMEVGLA